MSQGDHSCLYGFNSRTREGCDGNPLPRHLRRPQFQFTHPGGVRLDSIFSVRFDGTVSIHAPGRGATSHIMSIVASFTFQFTHPGGVRLLSTPRNTLELLFQFTHPGGVRPLPRYLLYTFLGVSIHAPGRGATHASAVTYRKILSFNSRTREGCDSPWLCSTIC